MKYKLKYLSVLLFTLFVTVSCDSFLDRQEDERLDFDKIWEQRSRTQQYFFNVMGYRPMTRPATSPGRDNLLKIRHSELPTRETVSGTVQPIRLSTTVRGMLRRCLTAITTIITAVSATVISFWRM